jgi:predicted transcriptional regulator
MDTQTLPILEEERWTIPSAGANYPFGSNFSVSEFFAANAAPRPLPANVIAPPYDKTISSMMRKSLWTVDAEDTVEVVEEILANLDFAPVSVVGSNGAIVGIIGQKELARFHVQHKNVKTVQAWEISRCTMFEVRTVDLIEDVSKLMIDNQIDYLSVTEDGVLKGVVSVLDVLKGLTLFAA